MRVGVRFDSVALITLLRVPIAVPMIETPILELVRERRSRSATMTWARVLFESNVAFSLVGWMVMVEFVTETETLNVVGSKLIQQRWLPIAAY